MEHYRSTLATTAVAVFGLVAAAHILHPGNYEDQPRRSRTAVAVPQAPAPAISWIDPPTELRAYPSVAEAATITVVPTANALMSGATAQILAAEMASSPRRPSAASAVPKRRAAHHTTRVRQASLDGARMIEPPAKGPTTAPTPRPDPIGALIRGLEAELGS